MEILAFLALLEAPCLVKESGFKGGSDTRHIGRKAGASKGAQPIRLASNPLPAQSLPKIMLRLQKFENHSY